MVKSFSSLCKLLQITAWANRFVKNCRSKQKIGALTSSEITKARVQWIKHVQYEVIDTMDVKKLQNNDVITLGLKIDEDGILRYHGRFNNADISEETKIPIYLPRKNYWTELLVKRISSKVISWWIITYTITNSKPLLDPTRTSYGKKRDISLWNMQKKSWWSIQDAENVTLYRVRLLRSLLCQGKSFKKDMDLSLHLCCSKGSSFISCR